MHGVLSCKKCGLSAGDAQGALDTLERFRFVSVRTVDMDEEKINVYSLSVGETALPVYAVYSLAGRLADYRRRYFGFTGGGSWLCE